jgi:predicted flavoprotein YhiN
MGEMLDWDAPTGGYLLQACFSMGKCLADKLNFSLFEEGSPTVVGREI